MDAPGTRPGRREGLRSAGAAVLRAQQGGPGAGLDDGSGGGCNARKGYRIWSSAAIATAVADKQAGGSGIEQGVSRWANTGRRTGR